MKKIISVAIICLIILTGCGGSKKEDAQKSIKEVQTNLDKLHEVGVDDEESDKIEGMVAEVKKLTTSAEYQKYQDSVKELNKVDQSKLDDKLKPIFNDFKAGHEGLAGLYLSYYPKLEKAKNTAEFNQISEESAEKMAVPSDKIQSSFDDYEEYLSVKKK